MDSRFQIVAKLAEDLQSESCPDVVWSACVQACNQMGADAMGYGFVPLETEVKYGDVTSATVLRQCYPRSWIDAVGDGNLLEADFTIPSLLAGANEVPWHEPPEYMSREENARYRRSYYAQLEFDKLHNMHVGMTVALERAGGKHNLVSSGIGFQLGQVTEKEFDKYWRQYGAFLRMIGTVLDMKLRVSTPNALFQLSRNEIDCLNFAASGLKNCEIAFRLRMSEDQIKKHFFRSRKKLSAMTRDHAVAKAMSIGLLSI